MVVMGSRSVWRSNPNRYSLNDANVTMGTAKPIPTLNTVQSYHSMHL